MPNALFKFLTYLRDIDTFLPFVSVAIRLPENDGLTFFIKWTLIIDDLDICIKKDPANLCCNVLKDMRVVSSFSVVVIVISLSNISANIISDLLIMNIPSDVLIPSLSKFENVKLLMCYNKLSPVFLSKVLMFTSVIVRTSSIFR